MILASLWDSAQYLDRYSFAVFALDRLHYCYFLYTERVCLMFLFSFPTNWTNSGGEIWGCRVCIHFSLSIRLCEL